MTDVKPITKEERELVKTSTVPLIIAAYESRVQQLEEALGEMKTECQRIHNETAFVLLRMIDAALNGETE